MAKIRPFQAWHYNSILAQDLPSLAAPLSETLLKQKQEAFYTQPFHYFHISSPMDVPPYENAKRRVENWKLDKVIRQDPIPALYVYDQLFRLEDEGPTCSRKGFFAHIEALPFSEKVVLPHEKTLSRAVSHRQQLLLHTQMHTIPTHGFYNDPACRLESYMEESLQSPFYEMEDVRGTRHRLSKIQDLHVIAEFQKVLGELPVWIADGHHRYESSVWYREEALHQNLQHTGEEAYNFHLMWLSNTSSSAPGILPTHRIVHSLPNFNSEEFLQALEANFDIDEIPVDCQHGPRPYEEPGNFVLLLKEANYRLFFKKDKLSENKKEVPEVVKKLDISILHHFILEHTLGLDAAQQEMHLEFSQYAAPCFESIQRENAQLAILTRPVSLDEIEQVCHSGATMPPKSTYFFPKVLGGFVFSSVNL